MLTLFSRSWFLLRNNLLLLVPGLFAGIVTWALRNVFFTPTSVAHGGVFLGFAETLRRWFAFGSLTGIMTLLAIVATTSMAGRVWHEGSATLDDATRVFRENKNELYLTVLQIIGIAGLAVLMVIPTGGISICAAFFLMIYAVASAVIGQQPGFEAVRESFSIATHRVADTAIMIVIFLCFFAISGMVSAVFGGMFLVGPLIVAVLNQLVMAYVTLVVVGAYIRAKLM